MHLDLSLSVLGYGVNLTFGELADEPDEVFHASDLAISERVIPYGFSSEPIDEEDDFE